MFLGLTNSYFYTCPNILLLLPFYMINVIQIQIFKSMFLNGVKDKLCYFQNIILEYIITCNAFSACHFRMIFIKKFWAILDNRFKGSYLSRPIQWHGWQTKLETYPKYEKVWTNVRGLKKEFGKKIKLV